VRLSSSSRPSMTLRSAGRGSPVPASMRAAASFSARVSFLRRDLRRSRLSWGGCPSSSGFIAHLKRARYTDARAILSAFAIAVGPSPSDFITDLREQRKPSTAGAIGLCTGLAVAVDSATGQPYPAGMPEPVTAGFLKGLSELATALWSNGALLLWCLTTAGAAGLSVLSVLSLLHVEHAQTMLSSYGTETALAVVVLAVFAVFKAYTERAARPLVFIAQEQQSFWGETRQSTGQVTAQITLRFQVTNVADRNLKLSDVQLVRPWVRRSSIIQRDLHVRQARDERGHAD
jgi:hypothetical protein